jgi:hypothetical protein
MVLGSRDGRLWMRGSPHRRASWGKRCSFAEKGNDPLGTGIHGSPRLIETR